MNAINWCTSPRQRLVRGVTATLFLLGLLIVSCRAGAQGFSVYISPPLHELKGKPGQTIRQTVELTSGSQLPSGFKAYTADWRLNDDGTAHFVDSLEPDSCRPWVAIERREFRLAPRAKSRFRFEVYVPADAVSGECRFALMFEGADPIELTAMNNLPLAARVAVVVYVAVGDARPQLQLVDNKVVKTANNVLGALKVRNSGQAHGRLGGILRPPTLKDSTLKSCRRPSRSCPYGRPWLLCSCPPKARRSRRQYHPSVFEVDWNGKEETFQSTSPLHHEDLHQGWARAVREWSVSDLRCQTRSSDPDRAIHNI